MRHRTGQSFLSCKLDGERIDLVIDWSLTSGRPAALNCPAEPDEIDIDGGWIDEGFAMTSLKESQIEDLYQNDVFMSDLMTCAMEEIQAQVDDQVDLEMSF